VFDFSMSSFPPECRWLYFLCLIGASLLELVSLLSCWWTGSESAISWTGV
jgi:hypothetical protein